MEKFTLNIGEGAQCTGLYVLPEKGPHNPLKGLPLLVCLHGGTYNAKYFDAHPRYSIKPWSESLGVPTVSVNRPGYAGSTGFPDIQDDEDWLHALANRFNEQVLPAIWERFGLPYGATCVVLNGHSLGAMSALVIAAFYARLESPRYPLAGIILTGLTAEVNPILPGGEMHKALSEIGPDNRWPREQRDRFMLKPQYGLSDPAMFSDIPDLNEPRIMRELEDVHRGFFKYWPELAKDISVPVMCAAGSHDAYFRADAVHEFAAAFSNSRDVQSILIKDAPHSLEMSYAGPSYMVRCIAFAMEAAVKFGIGHVDDFRVE